LAQVAPNIVGASRPRVRQVMGQATDHDRQLGLVPAAPGGGAGIAGGRQTSFESALSITGSVETTVRTT
jgi:hypothetical protein